MRAPSNLLGPQEVFTKQNGYPGQNFKATWGMMQVGLISPNMFNVLVDNVVRIWLVMTVKDQAVAQEDW